MKELWPFLSRAVVKNLKKKENEGNFDCLDNFDESKFHSKLQSLAPSEAEFYGN